MDIIGNRTLRDLLYEKVQQFPNKTILLFEDAEQSVSSLTYEQFYNQVGMLSRLLISHGVRKGDRVCLHLPNSIEFFICWFAAASVGAVIVPTNTLSTREEMTFIAQHSASVLLVTEEPFMDKLKGIEAEVPKLRGILLARSSDPAYASQSLTRLMRQYKGEPEGGLLQPEDLAAIMYTSGTTSRPKGVMITHANYIFAGEVMSKSVHLSPDDRQFIVLPLFHANAQFYSAMSALTVGASIAVTEKFSASRYFKQARKMEATVGSLFAAPIRMILQKDYDPEDRYNKLRVIWFAQVITPEQLERFEQNFDTKLLHIYGMTETICTPLANPIDGEAKNMGIGRPVLGYEVKIVDEDGEVPEDQVGQLIVKGTPGRTLMKGYLDDPESTEAALQGSWLYTGDNVRVDEDGYFFFVDRKKDMIKRAGENIAANEIEKVLNAHPAVFDCAVIGIPDEIRDETIKAFIVLHEGQRATEKEIIEFCQTRLSKFKIPEFIQFVKELPRTSVGKIQKHKLRSMYEDPAAP